MPFRKKTKKIEKKYGCFANEHSSLPFIEMHTNSLAAKENTQNLFGRAALFTDKKKAASLTVETAVVLPIFLFLCIALVFFIQIFAIHTEIQGALFRTARSLASNLLVINTGMDEKGNGSEVAAALLIKTSARAQVIECAKEQLDKYVCLQNGAEGLSFYYSSVSKDRIDLIVQYHVKLPYLFGLDITFPIVQRCRMHAWVGSDGTELADEMEEMVYITQNGTVYHKNNQCSHLKLSIHTVNSVDLAAKRNDSGGKYYPCEKCAPQGLTGGVGYITSDGNRYHNTLSCGGLKRTITVIPKSQAKGRSACSRCYK